MTSKATQQPKMIAFDLEPISHEEARSALIRVNRSRFGKLAADIVKTVSETNSPLRFPSKPMSPEMPVEERQKLITGLNNYFAKALPRWRVRYSATEKFFVVFELGKKEGSARVPIVAPARSYVPEDVSKKNLQILMAIARKTFKASDKDILANLDRKKAVLFAGDKKFPIRTTEFKN